MVEPPVMMYFYVIAAFGAILVPFFIACLFIGISPFGMSAVMVPPPPPPLPEGWPGESGSENPQ